MRKILLQRNIFSIVDDEIFETVKDISWSFQENRKNGHKYVRSNNNERIYLHRYIMNNPVGFVVDHINGNTLDNRKENLRVCTNSQNSSNQKIRKNNQYGLKGISFDRRRGKWYARIKSNNVTKYLGSFYSRYDAALAYNKASKLIHKEFGLTNLLSTP